MGDGNYLDKIQSVFHFTAEPTNHHSLISNLSSLSIFHPDMEHAAFFFLLALIRFFSAGLSVAVFNCFG